MPYTRLSYNCAVLDARSVDLTDRLWSTGFVSGFGVYETMRVDGGVLKYVPEHIARLLQSAALLRLEHRWSAHQVALAARDLVEQVCRTDQVQDFNLRMFLLGGPSAESAELWMHAQPRRSPSVEQYAQGVTASVVRVDRYLPQAKSLGQLAAYQAYRAALDGGHYEALLADAEGRICEGSRSNFLALRGDTLIVTPPDTVLGGVTQARAEKAARLAGLRVDASGINVGELATLDAALLCGTSIGLLPLRAVQDVKLTVACPAQLRLQAAFDQLR